MNSQTIFLIIIIIIIYYIGLKELIKQICQNNNVSYEEYNTMGQYVNIGNSMDFIKTKTKNTSPINKALLNSLVPDFEPSRLNINPDLNSYGYALNTPSSVDEYYMKRGFMNPEKEYKNTNLNITNIPNIPNNIENFGCLCKKKIYKSIDI